MTPFSDLFFTSFLISSIVFALELALINNYYDNGRFVSLIYIPTWWMIMFAFSYFMRYTLTQFFVMQKEAEKTSESLTQVLENLPSAVLMLE